MRKYITNQNGFLVVSTFIIGFIIMMLGLSSIKLITFECKKVFSNWDLVKARYIAEIGADCVIDDILKMSENIIMIYLEDLRDMKIQYLSEMANGEEKNEFDYPLLEIYLKDKLISQLKGMKRTKKNFLDGYMDNHSYNINLLYNEEENMIQLTSVGIYRRSRKQINVDIQLPYLIDAGTDEYGLAKINIYPAEVVAYYESIVIN